MRRSRRKSIVILFASCLWALSAPAFASEKDPFDLRVSEADAVGKKEFAILPYYPTYILPFTYQSSPNNQVFAREFPGKADQNVEVKYQISLRFPLWLDIANSGLNLYAGYTQLSFWQAYNNSDSSPFRDTTYEPELMLIVPWHFSLGPLTNHALQLAFDHQSNGRDSGEFKRSWNRLYARLMMTHGPLVLGVRAWYKMSNGLGSNQDIADYYGYGDLLARLHLGRHTLYAMLRNNLHLSDNRGALELGWTHPLIYGTRWYIQYWNGYGESLMDYNHTSQRIGVGILLGEWL